MDKNIAITDKTHQSLKKLKSERQLTTGEDQTFDSVISFLMAEYVFNTSRSVEKP